MRVVDNDALSALLKSVRIAGSLQFCVAAAGPWQTDGTPRLGRMFGAATPVIPFHIVARGGCWLRIDGTEVALEEGDVVAFPFATGHALGVGQEGPTINPVGDLPPKPWRDIPVLRYGRGDESTRLLCGFVALDAMNFAPLRGSLPLLLKAAAQRSDARPLLRSAVQQTIVEAEQRSPGGAPVLERLAEIILIELLRVQIGLSEGAAAQQPGGLFAAMADATLSRCLALVHEDPANDWTLDALARGSAVSRSVLEDRFQKVLGTSPMRYVRDWRLHLASRALSGTSRVISRIAEEAGYGTEAAFNRAFARAYGVPPARWRAQARAAAKA
jgi:AraC-like DNA-binding protein